MHAHKLGRGAVLAAVLTITAREVRADVIAAASMVYPQGLWDGLRGI